MIGTSDQSCWLAKACKVLLLLLHWHGWCCQMFACVCQVEPVQWSADHTRTVLSSAIASPNTLCSPPMIEAARLAVQEGYEGTMHR